MAKLLDEILEATRERVARARRIKSFDDLDSIARDQDPGRHFEDAIRGGEISVIAEFKRRSPSVGPIREDADPARVAAAYEEGGAAALSVLTEPQFFSGSLADLVAARAACYLPVLRKDFVIDIYQVAEARAAGADAILLIVAALPDQGLFVDLAEAAREYGLAALIEIHEAPELDAAFEVEPHLIGVNQRDLRTFEVDRSLAVRLRDEIPDDVAMVAESGIRTRADVAALEEAGVDAVLIGETLMRVPDPALAIRELLGRPHWMGSDEFLRRTGPHQADAALRSDLTELTPDTTDDLRPP